MSLSVFSGRDLQNVRAILHGAVETGLNVEGVFMAIDRELKSRQVTAVPPEPSPTNRHKSDNITTCSACGKVAVIVPLVGKDRSTTATHAIQCQNRPATDHPWRDGMCGYTEYIIRGER